MRSPPLLGIDSKRFAIFERERRITVEFKTLADESFIDVADCFISSMQFTGWQFKSSTRWYKRGDKKVRDHWQKHGKSVCGKGTGRI
ncbi:hypothetical protein GCM10023228_02640 [Brevibacillus fulvus]